MRAKSSLAFALVLGLAPLEVVRAAAPVLERVLLSTGGVGYLGYRATVGDDGKLRLTVPLRQVDDILKSLTILDGGTVRAVSLLGPTPLADLFRGAPFGEHDLADLPTLLASLRGAEVEVRGSVNVRGRILAVAREEAKEGEATTVRHRLSLLTQDGIRAVILESGVEGITLLDQALAQELDRVLARLADNRHAQERELEIGLGGAPGRIVELGYLAEMPLWKAGYRLVVGAEGEKDAGLLQGWAILENLSGQDWREVEVTLAAGSPVALKQALFRSYFVSRPEVPVVPEAQKPPVQTAAPRTALPSGPARERAGRGPELMAEAAPASAPAGLEVGTTQELTAQTLFRLPQKVSLPTGHTVMAPIVDAKAPVERLALYRADEGGPHPKAAVRLVNRTGASLPGGIATLYEPIEAGGLAYLGDVTLPAMAPGTDAILAYGRDGNIDVASSEEEEGRLDRVRIADGLMELSRIERRRVRYDVSAHFSGTPRSFVLEQKREEGWRVTEPADAVIQGDTLKVTRSLAPEAKLELAVVLERPVVERIELVDADPEQLRLTFQGATLAPEVRQALERLQALTARIADIDREIEAKEARRDERVKEQERLRANLAAVPRGSDLAKRYLDRLGASEDEIAKLGQELDRLRAAREQAAAERLAFIRSLRI
ncbi:hypothetical protein [Benzoatithermus flavus]|uniref:DUF4139 domain-containing protein n=1 Tax=Benzoatithermus flavus TaxID=3108223 RepID=A0ABU8XRC9_9PROT